MISAIAAVFQPNGKLNVSSSAFLLRRYFGRGGKNVFILPRPQSDSNYHAIKHVGNKALNKESIVGKGHNISMADPLQIMRYRRVCNGESGSYRSV